MAQAPATQPSAVASAPPTPSAAEAQAPAAPNADTTPQAAGPLPPGHANPHGAMKLVSGDPLTSREHMRQAELARAGQQFQPQSGGRPEPGMAPGTIGILVRDGKGQPLPNQRIELRVVHESIEQGNTESTAKTISNESGYAGFVDQNTDSQFNYEVVAHYEGAVYSSGQFNLDRDRGQLVTLHVFPTTKQLNEAFVFSRGLYVIEPRHDVFQVQVLIRFHNTNAITWTPADFGIDLPQGGSAFQPGNASGDLRMIEKKGRVHITGAFTPGQHEIAFNFQLPNTGSSTARLGLPVPPHLVDVKLYVESSSTTTLTVNGLDAATEARGKEGQPALHAGKDFLRTASPRPKELVAVIGGLPTTGSGALIASILAGCIALFGIAFALSTDGKRATRLAETDLGQARRLLLDELVLVERAFVSKAIGPKTYERTRRTLLDALARLEVTSETA
jgi:hypothetical protein